MPVDLTDIRPRMEKTLEMIRSEISSIRAGRASSQIVEDITCSVYGGSQHLKVVELANITAPDAQTIFITPWDQSIIGEMRQSIQAANVGLQPIIDGDKIRISIPPLSNERRQEFVKLLSRQIENGKVMIRQIRHDKMADIKKSFEDKEIGEDERFTQEEDLQKITDEFVEKIEEIGKAKEAELLSI